MEERSASAVEEWSAGASEVLERAVVEVPVKVLGGVLDVEEEGVPEKVGEGRRGNRQAMAPRAFSAGLGSRVRVWTLGSLWV